MGKRRKQKKIVDYKTQGNNYFTNKNYNEAIKFYDLALEHSKDKHLIYSNRSMSYLKLNNLNKALEDTDKCIELAPKWWKGYFRTGTV